MTEPESPRDPVEAIAAALARVRGRRGPRPPWDPDGAAGRGQGHRGQPGAPEGQAGPWPHGPHGLHGPHGGWDRGAGPGAFPQGPPPWMAAHGRLGGPARLRLLEALATASAPLSVSELAERIGVDQPRASRLVQQSVEMGLVRREADPDDARRTRIALTDTGSAVVRGFRGDRKEAVAKALAEFTDDERAELARLLTKFANAWGR